MPEIPEDAVQAAAKAAVSVYQGYDAEMVGGVDEEAARAGLEAAAPILAAQARAQALRDTIEGRVTLAEHAAAQGHSEPQRIEDLSSSIPFSQADMDGYFAAMEDRGPSYEEDLRADERRKMAEEIAARIEAEIDPLGLGPGSSENEAWRSGMRLAARLARQIGAAP